jgi:hypothetical protein
LNASRAALPFFCYAFATGGSRGKACAGELVLLVGDRVDGCAAGGEQSGDPPQQR